MKTLVWLGHLGLKSSFVHYKSHHELNKRDAPVIGNNKARVLISDRQCQYLLAALYLFVVAFWSIGIAFNGAPDESTHFFLLEYLNSYHSLPDASAPQQAFKGLISARTWQPGEFWYHGLPFPHVLGALVTTNLFGWLMPDSLLYIAARSINWIFGGIFVCAMFRTARTIGLGKTLSVLTAVIIALIPQVTFVFSYFNSDGYGLMSVALTLNMLFAYVAQPTLKRATFLGVALGTLFLAKAYFLPAVVFVALLLLGNHYLKKKPSKQHLIATLSTALAVALPLLIITYAHYGEVSGFSGQAAFVQLHKTNPAAGYGTCFIGCADHLLNFASLTPWTEFTLKSYFSVTGWMNVPLPTGYYQLAGLLLVSLIIFSLYQAFAIRKLFEKKHYAVDYIIPLVMILGLFPSIFILSLLASQASLPQPQGRYLFVTVPFLAVLLASATRQMDLRTTPRSTDPSIRTGSKAYGLILLLVAAWMSWTNLFAWGQNFSSTDTQKTPLMLILKHMVNGSIQQNSISPLQKESLISRLKVTGTQINLSVPFIDEIANGTIDEVRRVTGGFSVRGWTHLSNVQGRGQYVVVLEGTNIKALADISLSRPDVAKALGERDAVRSGYLINIPFEFEKTPCTVKLYTLSDDFKLYAMPDVCEKLGKL